MIRLSGGSLGPRIRLERNFVNRKPHRFGDVLIEHPELFVRAEVSVILPAGDDAVRGFQSQGPNVSQSAVFGASLHRVPGQLLHFRRGARLLFLTLAL